MLLGYGDMQVMCERVLPFLGLVWCCDYGETGGSCVWGRPLNSRPMLCLILFASPPANPTLPHAAEHFRLPDSSFSPSINTQLRNILHHRPNSPPHSTSSCETSSVDQTLFPIPPTPPNSCGTSSIDLVRDSEQQLAAAIGRLPGVPTEPLGVERRTFSRDGRSMLTLTVTFDPAHRGSDGHLSLRVVDASRAVGWQPQVC